jgi:integrase
MAKVRLTDKTLRRPAPATGQTELWDDLVPGFGLRIAAGGARTYFVMKRLNGKLVRRTVARVGPTDGPLAAGELALPDAREEARKLLSSLARGVDPDARKAAARVDPTKTPQTFSEVAAAYFNDPAKRGGAALRSKSELERKVRVDLAAWKDRSIAGLTRADVRAAINAKHAASPVSANRLLALVRRVFRWAVREDLISANPAMDIDPPAQEEERDRVLSLTELARVWAGAETMGYPYGPLIKMLILTAQRRSEVADLPWSEIDGTNWKLPDGRSKRGKGHLVPLSPLAVTILADLPKIGSKPVLVFTTGKRAAKRGEKVDPKAPPVAVSGWSRMKNRLDKVIAEAPAKAARKSADDPLDPEKIDPLAPWTLHDLRRSVATHLRDEEIMGEDRADRLTVSKILNHAEGGMTRLYDRYSSDPEKRRALEGWARVIERRSWLNVIDLGKARA